MAKLTYFVPFHKQFFKNQASIAEHAFYHTKLRDRIPRNHQISIHN